MMHTVPFSYLTLLPLFFIIVSASGSDHKQKWHFYPTAAFQPHQPGLVNLSLLSYRSNHNGSMRLATISNPVNRWSVRCPGCGFPTYNCSGEFERVDDQALHNDCEYATNASPFDMISETSGCLLPVVSDGVITQPPSATNDDHACFGMVQSNENSSIAEWAWAYAPHDIPANMTQMVCGFQMVVHEGKSLMHKHGGLIAPRTVVGFDKQGRMMSLVIDGSEVMKWGATMYEVGKVMEELGAWTAINLDGGGSSATFYKPSGGIVGCPTCVDRPECCVRKVTTISCVRNH